LNHAATKATRERERNKTKASKRKKRKLNNGKKVTQFFSGKTKTTKATKKENLTFFFKNASTAKEMKS